MDRLILTGLNLRDRLELGGHRLRAWIRRRSGNDRGQGSLEYVMIIALVVIVIFTLLWFMKDQLFNVVNRAVQKVKEWADSTSF